MGVVLLKIERRSSERRRLKTRVGVCIAKTRVDGSRAVVPKKSNGRVDTLKKRYPSAVFYYKDVQVRRVVSPSLSRWTIRKWRDQVESRCWIEK